MQRSFLHSVCVLLALTADLPWISAQTSRELYNYDPSQNNNIVSLKCNDPSPHQSTSIQIVGASTFDAPCYCALTPSTGSYSNGPTLQIFRYTNNNWEPNGLTVNVTYPGFGFQATNTSLVYLNSIGQYVSTPLSIQLSGYAGGGQYFNLQCGSSSNIAFANVTTTSTSTSTTTSTTTPSISTRTTTTPTTTTSTTTTTTPTTTTSTTTTPTTTTSTTTTTTPTTTTSTTTTPTTTTSTTTTPTTTTSTTTTTTPAKAPTTPSTTTTTPKAPTTTTTSVKPISTTLSSLSSTSVETQSGTATTSQSTTSAGNSAESSSLIGRTNIIIIIAVVLPSVFLFFLISAIVVCCRSKSIDDDEADRGSHYEEIEDKSDLGRTVKPASYEVMDQRGDLYSEDTTATRHLDNTSDTATPTEAHFTERGSPSPSDKSLSLGHSVDNDDANLLDTATNSADSSIDRNNPPVQVNPLFGADVAFSDSANPTPASTLRSGHKDKPRVSFKTPMDDDE